MSTKAKLVFFACVLFFWGVNLHAQSGMKLRWVGANPGVNASGTWNTPSHWRRISGGVLNTDYEIVSGQYIPKQQPRSIDDVQFDAADITPITTITLTSDALCKDLLFLSPDDPLTSSFEGEVITITGNYDFYIYGKLKMLSPSGGGTYNSFLWNVTGRMIFAASSPGTYEVDFQNVPIKDEVVFNSAAGLNVTWLMTGDLTMDTLTGTNANKVGRVRLVKGHLNTNGKKITANMFFSHNDVAERKLTLGASEIELWGNGRWEPPTTTNEIENSSLPFQANFTSAAQVDAGTSTIILKSPGGSPRFGSGITLNKVIFDNYTPNSSCNVRIPGNNGKIKYLEIKANVGTDNSTSITNIGGGSSTVDELVLHGRRFYSFGINLTIGKITVINNCGHFATLSSSSRGTNRTLTATASVDSFNLKNVALRRITIARASPTRPVAITNYIDLGHNSFPSGVTPSVAVPRTLYWVGGDGNWNDPNHWSLTSGGTPIGGSCYPTLNDSVVFDANSDVANVAFTVSLSAITPGSSDAYQCRGMYWSPTTVANSKLNMQAPLNVYGSLYLKSGCLSGSTTEGRTYLYGRLGACSITSNGAAFPSRMVFSTGCIYNIIDNTTIGDNLLTLECTIIASNVTINVPSYSIEGGNVIWNINNTTFNLSSSGPYNQFSVPTFNQTGTNIFNFTNGGTIVISTNDNMVIKTPSVATTNSSSTLTLSDRGRGLRVEGNMTLAGSAFLNGASSTSSRYDTICITGNLNLSEGKSYLFPSGTSSIPLPLGETNRFIRVIGNFTATSACQGNAIAISGALGNQTNLKLSTSSVVTVEYAILSGIAASKPCVANNSLNSGGNVNWTFPVSIIPKTFYWRRKKGSSNTNSANWNGNWSDINHWTITQTNTEGDGVCLPSPFDHVVFDDLSRRLPTDIAVVTIDDLASCANFTTTYTGTGGNRFVGSRPIYISGSMDLHPNTSFIGSTPTSFTSSYIGTINFSSTTTNTIKTNGVPFNNNTVNFNGVGGQWTLLSSLNAGNSGTISISYGNFISNGYAINTGRFVSVGTSPRTINLNNSTLTVNSAGTGSLNIATGHAFDFSTSTNLTFSNINGKVIMTAQDAKFNGGNATFGTIDFTNSNSTQFIARNFKAYKAKFAGSGQGTNSGGIFGDNFIYDTLKLAAGKTYAFEPGKTLTFSDTAWFVASGLPGNFTKLRLPQGTPSGLKSTMKKDGGGPFCFDYLSVDGIEAKTLTGSAVEFKTGANSDCAYAPGVWACNKLTWYEPKITSGPDQVICKGSFAPLSFTLQGRGAYIVKISGSDGSNLDTVFSDQYPSGSAYIRVKPLATTTYTIDSIKSYDCDQLKDGSVIIDPNQTLHVIQPDIISTNNKTCNCPLSNDDTYVLFTDTTTANKMPIVSINDYTGAGDNISLGATTASVFITPTVQSFSGEKYLQRYFRIVPTNNGAAKVRVYVPQSEIDALATALGKPVALTDLNATLFPAGRITNNPSSGAITSMDITGAEFLTAIASGTAGADVTTTPNVRWIEFLVPHFSDLVLHASSSILPLKLADLKARVIGNERIEVSWTSLSEDRVLYYLVERASQNSGFSPIGRVSAAGTGKYSFMDNQPMEGVNYYRIVAIDDRNKKEVSKVVSAEIVAEQASIALYPNPSPDGQIVIRLGSTPKPARLEVFDGTGMLVHQTMLENTVQTVNLSHLESGIYIAVITPASGEPLREKIVIGQ